MRRHRPWRIASLLNLLAVITLAGVGCGPKTQPGVRPPAPHDSKHPELSSGGGLFSEVASAAGIHYRWEVAGPRPLNILQTIGNGCAFLDYDQDGSLDILLVGPHPGLYLGDGHGHFTDVTAATGFDKRSGQFLGCAVGDYDNDGFPDVYLTAYQGGALLHNEATGKSRLFRDVTQQAGIPPQSWASAAAFVDIDGDEKLDLYIGNYVVFGPTTQPRLCEYSGHMSSCGPRFYQPERAFLYRNEGNGRFRDVTAAWGVQRATGKALGIACADFDGSGRQSIALANDEVAGDLFRNQGKMLENAGAQSSTAYDNNGNVHGGMGIDWGDYDNDGRLDLAVATFQHEAKCLYHNDNGRFFVERSAALGLAEKTAPNVAFGCKFLDYDNDGFLDLMLANGHVQDNIAEIDKSTTYRQPTQLFRNISGQRFEEVSSQAGPAFRKPLVGRGLAIGDYDNDGKVDALVVDSEGEPLLLHNETPDAGHWLLLKLIGTKSNRHGIGALVTVEAGGIKLLRRCAADGSYMSASDPRIHAGLGKASTADVTVRWPSGLKSIYKHLSADRLYILREGDPTTRQ